MRQQSSNPPPRPGDRRLPPDSNQLNDRMGRGEDPYHYPLPGIGQSDARHVNALENGAGNFFLRFHRFLGYPSKWEFKTPAGKDDKENRWKSTLKRGNTIFKDPDLMKGLYQPFFQEQATLLDGVDPSRKRQIPLPVKARLCMGLAELSSLETGMKLHPLYGVPYIPGSAVKGVTRSAWLLELASRCNVPYLDPLSFAEAKRITKTKSTPLELFEELALSEELQDKRLLKMKEDWRRLGELVVTGLSDLFAPEAINKVRKTAELYRKCFGSQEAMGEVVFFDAYPDLQGGKDLFELDVLTPHYSEYYSGSGTPPADYLSPVPTFFLTVKPETTFLFRLYHSGADVEVLSETERWLKTALTFLGIGGKTSVGYGFF